MGPEAELTRREIAKFSERDAERHPQYEAMLERVAAVVEPTLTMAPPDLLHPRPRDLRTMLSLGRSFRRLGDAAGEAVEILTGAARPILDRWFESEELKGTLATDAVIGAMASPSMPGTAYVLFHHVMGERRRAGVWAYVRGGMGGLTQALASAARDLGAEIRCDAEVARILVRDGKPSAWRWPTATSSAAGRGQQRRRQRDLPAPARPRRARGVRGRRRTDQLRQRLAEDQRRPGRAPRLRALSRAPSRQRPARSTSVPTRTTSSAPSTTPSTGAPPRSPSWSARSPRRSTRQLRHPAAI